jgi:hypothetical protein
MFEETHSENPRREGPREDAVVESADQLTFELNIREFAFEDRNDDALRFDLPVVGRRSR